MPVHVDQPAAVLPSALLPCRSPSTRRDAVAAFRTHAESTRATYPAGHASHISRSNANRIVTLFGQACDALRIGEDDDVVPRLMDLCNLRAGQNTGLARLVPADAAACARRLIEAVYGFRSVRSLTWTGETILAAPYRQLLSFAEGDVRAAAHLTVLMRVLMYAFPTLDAPRQLPSSQEISAAAPTLPCPVAPGSIKSAVACYRRLRERAIAANPASREHYAAIPDPRRTKGRGLLAALAASSDAVDRRLAEDGDLKAAIQVKAPIAYKQMVAYEANPRGLRGELHSLTYVEEMWGNMSGVLGELHRHAPELLPSFEIRRLWSDMVEARPTDIGLDEWNADIVLGTAIRVPLARWLIDRCASSSRALSTHRDASTGYTDSLATDVTGWWTLTELFYGTARRAAAPEQWELWERTYANLRRDMRAAPVPKDERTNKATLARMQLVSLPHVWCIGLPLLGREAERLLHRFEQLKHLAESTGHADPCGVDSVRKSYKIFTRAAEEYLIAGLVWVDTMRFSQYRYGRWGDEFVPDYDARGRMIALHCNWTGRRLNPARAKMGAASRRAYGSGLLNLRVLEGYLTHVRIPRLMRLGAAQEAAAEANGLYPLFVSPDAESLGQCAYSETTIRKDRYGPALYRIATAILGRELPPYETLDRAAEWRAAWSLHDVRHDVATIVGALMKLWERACEMTMDTPETLRDNYWEKSFQPIGAVGEWECIETYYPWVRALLDDPRRAPCPLDDPALPLPPGARAMLDTWAAEGEKLARKGRRSRHGVGDARMRRARPDVAARNGLRADHKLRAAASHSS